MKALRSVGLACALAAGGLLLTGCSETVPTGSSDAPDVGLAVLGTEPDDGLTSRDISGISATGFRTAGVGTASRDAETITVTVPSGASISKVYLYWARRIEDPDNAPTSDVKVDGTEVSGNVIGGVIETGVQNPVSYRADITSSNVVSPGTSSFTVEDEVTNESDEVVGDALGASVLVFFDEGGTSDVLRLYDGVDFVYRFASNPDPNLKEAEPVTFTFPAAAESRSARLDLMVGDVEVTGPSEPTRPNELDITIGGTTTTLQEPFTAADGAEWDNFLHSITIPSGVTEVTVEPISPNEEDAQSLVWVTAGLSIQQPPSGGEGCTPGYWRQEHHFDSWVGYAPGDKFGSVFDLPDDLARPEHRTDPADVTLLDALKLRGGGVNALMRHAVAALLNASSGDVSYDLTEAQVISKFNAAIATGGDIEGTKDELVDFNEQGCPLD